MRALPVHWEIRPLTDVAEVRLGRQRSPKNHAGSQMRPYVRAANVGWSGLRLDDVKTMNFTDAEMHVYRLRGGDLLLSEASGSPGEVGKPALWSGELPDCGFQNTLIRVRSLGPEPRYLLHYFRHVALSGGFTPHSRGVGIHHLGRARLASWETPLPPVDEQRRIVEILEDHLSLLDAATAALGSLSPRIEALRRSRLMETFAELTWSRYPRARLESLIASDRKIAYGVLIPGPDIPDGVPMIRIGDMRNGSVDPTSLKRISPAIDAKFPRTRLQGGEVMLSVVGTIGRTAVVPGSLAGANVARAVSILPLRKGISPHFISYALQAPANQRLLIASAHEVARKTLNLEDVKCFEVPIPPRSEQDRIVARLDSVMTELGHSSLALQTVSDRTRGLRLALLAAAFSGRLTGRSSDLDRVEEMASP